MDETYCVSTNSTLCATDQIEYAYTENCIDNYYQYHDHGSNVSTIKSQI